MARRSSRRAVSLLLFVGAVACSSARITPNTRPHDDVSLQALTPGVFVHTSWHTLPALGEVPANGLLVCAGGDGLLVDSAWTNAQTERLLALAEAKDCPVKALLVSHFHDDRMGGLAAVRGHGIPTYATADTVRRAQVLDWRPTLLASPTEVRAGDARVEVFFPGAAHSPDNIVVWSASARVLFGGCMVREATGESLGNVSDADVGAWPASVRNVIARYGSALYVVPGHGPVGGSELLDHTLHLAEAAADAGR